MAEKKEYSGVKANDVDIEMAEKGKGKENQADNDDMTEHQLTLEVSYYTFKLHLFFFCRNFFP
jgi:hypothetical protein